MDVLHDDEVVALLLAQAEDLDDVRVVQHGRDAGLVQELLHEVRIIGQVLVDPLEHHVLGEAAEADLPGEEHLPHAAPGDLSDDLVADLLGLGL